MQRASLPGSFLEGSALQGLKAHEPQVQSPWAPPLASPPRLLLVCTDHCPHTCQRSHSLSLLSLRLSTLYTLFCSAISQSCLRTSPLTLSKVHRAHHSPPAVRLSPQRCGGFPALCPHAAASTRNPWEAVVGPRPGGLRLAQISQITPNGCLLSVPNTAAHGPIRATIHHHVERGAGAAAVCVWAED